MDVRKEFVDRVNDTVKQQCQAAVGDRTGEEITVIIPLPDGIFIDCSDTRGIELDEAEISTVDKVTDPETGEVILDGPAMGLTLYQITGRVR